MSGGRYFIMYSCNDCGANDPEKCVCKELASLIEIESFIEEYKQILLDYNQKISSSRQKKFELFKEIAKKKIDD